MDTRCCFVGENKNPFVKFDLKYEVSVGKSKSTEMDSVFLSMKVSEIVELFGRYFQIGIYEKNLEACTLCADNDIQLLF